MEKVILAYEGDAPFIRVNFPPEFEASIQRFADAVASYGSRSREAAVSFDEMAAMITRLTRPPSYAHIHRVLARGAAHKRKQDQRRAGREIAAAIFDALNGGSGYLPSSSTAFLDEFFGATGRAGKVTWPTPN